MHHSPVNTYTEWDPLEEVIVGTIEGACFPTFHKALKPIIPHAYHRIEGKPFPLEQINAAKKELDELVYILEQEGVIVKRPLALHQEKTFGTAEWSSTGLYTAMPRDVLLAIGNEIIECPMPWRCRYNEVFGYRKIIKEYFKAGAMWSAAPKPELNDELYYALDDIEEGTHTSVVSEYEPVFDAADFVKCGKDILAQKSNVTNQMGIDWLQQHLGSTYKIHVFEFKDPHPMHIDATIMPVGAGKLLINPERVIKVPEIFKGWDILSVPKPIIPKNHTLYMTSKWINMNILMLDEKRVIVEKQDEPMISAFKKWGFTAIKCNFRNFNTFGGSFHCATLDIRRRGKL